ncbi:MAG: hypothetical protein F6K30_26975 [Cyanothece sp. SIO2G6]|nr:hypothetical protein [Cyanothece sp. SIO2G6]
MTPLTVSLPRPLTAYLPEQLATGPYNTADDYIQSLIQQDKVRATVCQNQQDCTQHG